MESLREYLNSLSLAEQQEFARRCGTTIGYIRKKLSLSKRGGRFGEALAIAFERESGGRIRCEDICPDVDWAYVRNSGAELSTINRKCG